MITEQKLINQRDSILYELNVTLNCAEVMELVKDDVRAIVSTRFAILLRQMRNSAELRPIEDKEGSMLM